MNDKARLAKRIAEDYRRNVLYQRPINPGRLALWLDILADEIEELERKINE